MYLDRDSATKFLREHSDERARAILEEYRWPGGRITCPLCNSWRPIYKESRNGVSGYYRCPAQHKTDVLEDTASPIVFTVRTGTILARSHLPSYAC